MTDIVSPELRSRMMANIRGKNTRPEITIRKGLHALGFRFRLHNDSLPGCPDIVFPRYRATIFAHGCFWHGHDCHLFKWPSSRSEFWRTKIERNRSSDLRVKLELSKAGWRTAVVWECALKGRTRLPLDKLLRECSEWLKSDQVFLELRGG